MKHLDFAIEYMTKHGALLRRRFFSRASWQDWEDFTQEVLLYIWQTPSFTFSNLGWKGWIVQAIWCRAQNRLRGENTCLRGEVEHHPDMDRYAAAELGVDQMCVIREAIDGFASATRRFLGGESRYAIAGKTKQLKRTTFATRYARFNTQLNADRAAFKEVVCGC